MTKILSAPSAGTNANQSRFTGYRQYKRGFASVLFKIKETSADPLELCQVNNESCEFKPSTTMQGYIGA